MNEHALDAMIYAWMVMKEKEENKMEGIYVGKITRSKVDKGSADLLFIDHCQDVSHLDSLIEYDDTAYCLVPTDDIIINNDELLKLRDEVKRLTDECKEWDAECNDWKARYSKANNELFQKGLAYSTLETTYKNEKIAGEMLLKDRDALKEKVEKLEAELMEIKTTRTLREAYITGVEKGIHIGVCGNDEECNAGIVVVDNMKAEDLEKQVGQMEDANQKLRQRISAADEEIDRLKGDNSAKAKAVIRAEYRGDAWMDKHEKLIRKYHELEQRHDAKWTAMTEALKDKGVEVIYMGEQDGKPIIDIKVPVWEFDKQWVTKFAKQCADFRADKFRLERERDELKEQCLKLKEDLNDLKKEHGRVLGEFALCRKQAEEDHKKLEELKSRTLDNVEIRLSNGDIVWTYCDGFVHVSSGIINADEISTGTVPKCSSCANYMHNPSRYAHDWCYRPVPKEGGAGYIRKLNKEEVEGPACSDFKARKE